MKSPEKTEEKVAAHPKVCVMVDTAIKTLAEPKGTSLRAINKFINANYTVDIKRLSKLIKKHLKASLERGDLVQSKGNGFKGSFKISKKKSEAKPKAPKVKSPSKAIKLTILKNTLYRTSNKFPQLKKDATKSPKALKEKSSKSHKMQTSASNKYPQSKKAATKSPNKSIGKKLKLTDSEAVPADATFPNPNIKKVKEPKVSVSNKPRQSIASVPTKVKPKKLAKKTEPKDITSPGVKSENNRSPKLVHTKRHRRKQQKPRKLSQLGNLP